MPWDAAEVACQSAEFSACVIRLYNTAADGGEQIAEDPADHDTVSDRDPERTDDRDQTDQFTDTATFLFHLESICKSAERTGLHGTTESHLADHTGISY